MRIVSSVKRKTYHAHAHVWYRGNGKQSKIADSKWLKDKFWVQNNLGFEISESNGVHM